MDVLIVVGALFAGVGALLFAVGAFFLRAGRRFDRGAVRAPGQVVDVRWQTLGTAGAGRRQPRRLPRAALHAPRRA